MWGTTTAACTEEAKKVPQGSGAKENFFRSLDRLGAQIKNRRNSKFHKTRLPGLILFFRDHLLYLVQWLAVMSETMAAELK